MIYFSRILLAPVVLVSTLTACGGSHSSGIPGANVNAAACDKAQEAAAAIAPTFTAVENGTKGADDLDAPLVTAAARFRDAASSASGITRDDFNQMAADFDNMRAHLKTATSWDDLAVKADSTAIKDDTEAVRADCP